MAVLSSIVVVVVAVLVVVAVTALDALAASDAAKSARGGLARRPGPGSIRIAWSSPPSSGSGSTMAHGSDPRAGSFFRVTTIGRTISRGAKSAHLISRIRVLVTF